MSLTLDANLQTQLDGIERQPVAKVVTTSFSSAIPFNGNNFATYATDHDLQVDLRLHSGGGLTLSTYYDTDQYFRYFYTDSDRLVWTQSIIQIDNCNALNNLNNVSHVEMANGNIGISWTEPIGLGFYVKTAIIDSSTLTWSSGSTVMTSANNDVFYQTFLLYVPDTAKYQLYVCWYDDSATDYFIYKWETSTFGTWGSPTDVTPSSLGNTYKYHSLHAIVLSDSDIVVSFDRTTQVDGSGFETTQVYYMVSQDDGTTWSTPTAVTSFTGTGTAGRHPTVSEKTSGVYFVFHERKTFVTFDDSTQSVLTDCSGEGVMIDDVWLYNNYIYATGCYTHSGTKNICGMWVIDPSDMSLHKQYTGATTPGYDSNLSNFHSWYYWSRGAGKYMVRRVENWDHVSATYLNIGQVILGTYDGVTDQVTQYVIGSGEDSATYGWDENVSVEWANNPVSNYELYFAWADDVNEKLYLWMFDSYAYSQRASFGYIDLTETANPVTGYYTYNEVSNFDHDHMMTAYGWALWDYGLSFDGGRFCKEDNKIVLWRRPDAGESSIVVLDCETGVIQYAGTSSTDSNVPYLGLHSAYIYNNTIYGSFFYSTASGQGSWRGLWTYNILTGSRLTVRPGYETKDQYWFHDYDFSDISNNYVWIASTDGAIRYHIGAQTFELWNDDNVPGYDMGMAEEYCHAIAYDTSSGNVYTGSNKGATEPFAGLRGFNKDGDYFKGQYATGTKSGTDLGLGTINDLTTGNFEKDLSTVVDGDDVLWAYWDHVDYSSTTRTVHWDNDVSEFDCSDDLTEVVQVSHAIDTPSEVLFYLGNGYLYEQQNSLSNRSYMFRKGRKITVQLGENVSGTPYWVDQGEYIVEETKMVYKRPDHPTLEVIARTMDSLWRDHKIALTSYYDSAQPKAIVEDLIGDWTVLGGAEYTIPTYDDSHEIWHQWSDDSLYDIIKDINDHMGYVGVFDNTGVYTPLKLDFEKAVDHTYSNQTHVEEYSPDTSFSNFVNQIRVIGETHDFIEVVYDAEMITTLVGTCGWWNETIVHRVYYNEERTRTCRNPYIVANISTGDFSYFIFKGGGKEYITDEDNNETWVEITIIGPNLIPVVVGLAIAVVTVGTAALHCGVTYSCGPWILATNVLISLLCYALLATATYDIEVWAHPIGQQKQTIQYIAYDNDALNIINQQPVMEEIEDPLCYTVGDCQRVAEFELNVLRYQRERIRLTKLAHLQDELLDMLVVAHPYTSHSMQILVASLIRTLQIRGQMMDTIEGWRIA